MAVGSTLRWSACRHDTRSVSRGRTVTSRVIAAGEAHGLDAIALLNRPVYLAYDELMAALGSGSGETTLFARPVENGAMLSWMTDLDGSVRRWSDMSPDEQAVAERKRRDVKGSLALRIELLSRSGPNSRHAAAVELIRAALNVPGPDAVFVVGAQPVLTFWGFARRDEAAFDPFAAIALRLPPTPPAAPTRRHTLWLLLALLAAACLIIAGVYIAIVARRPPVLPSLPRPFVVVPKAAAPPVPPRVSKVVPPRAHPTAALLGDRLTLPPDLADLSFLKGRWAIKTGLRWGNMFHTEPVEMSLDVDDHGGGTISIDRSQPRQVCSAPVEVQRANISLTLQSRFRLRCADGSLMTSVRITCVQQDDGSALCHGINLPDGNSFEAHVSKLPS